jgi:hypothetical protein
LLLKLLHTQCFLLLLLELLHSHRFLLLLLLLLHQRSSMFKLPPLFFSTLILLLLPRSLNG